MQLTNKLKLILAPLLAGAGMFFLIFVLFTTTYVFFEYRDYRSVYQEIQQRELNTIQQKIEVTFKKVAEMLRITGTRIAESQDDLQRIQNILVSASRLYSPQELPNIQGLVYYVLSQPYRTVSRFGIFPSETQTSPISQLSSKAPIE